MRDVEELLYKEKSRLDQIQAPAELEERLRGALQKKPAKKSKWTQHKGLIAAVITLMIVFTYSYDSLAYYGKMLFGYETIVHGNLHELNNEGAGQEINRSHIFGDGTEIVLDGIMFDENELVAFYKVIRRDIKNSRTSFLMEINGLRPIRYSASGGVGKIIDDRTQIWIQSFEAPKFYEKRLSLDITMIGEGKSEIGSIPFSLDRSKAMKRIVKQDINEETTLDGFTIHFKSLTASRLNTSIEGTITPAPVDKPPSAKMIDMNADLSLQFDLYIDDQLYTTSYAGISTSNQTEFKSESMGLPAKFKTMEIKNIRLVEMKKVDQSVPIRFDMKDTVITEDLIIHEVYQKGETIHMYISSRGLPVMGLFSEDVQMAGQNEHLSHLPESEHPVKRLYQFQGIGRDMKLMIKVISYTRYADKSIPIQTD